MIWVLIIAIVLLLVGLGLAIGGFIMLNPNDDNGEPVNDGDIDSNGVVVTVIDNRNTAYGMIISGVVIVILTLIFMFSWMYYSNNKLTKSTKDNFSVLEKYDDRLRAIENKINPQAPKRTYNLRSPPTK